jgi:hypothetical protein
MPHSGDRPFNDRDRVAHLIADHLDSYAYERLPKPDRTWWESRWNEDEEAGAFSRLFGPEWIVEIIDDFLGWFVFRKVMAPPEQVATFGPLCEELLRWMASEGHATLAQVAGPVERARRAADELPLADELGTLLYASSEAHADDEVTETADWVDQMAVIVRTEPGALWFRSETGRELGPVRVPERAAEIARVGWQVSAASFGRLDDGWCMLEIGNVYPP